MPVSPDPAPPTRGTKPTRGMSFLVGAALMLALLIAGSTILSNAPDGAIVGPNEVAGGRDAGR